MAVVSQAHSLPNLDDLPLVADGYEREAVRVAFETFYRHAAQLDASLAAIQAIEVFRRDAEALRNDLRAWRTLGLSFGQSDGSRALPVYDDRRLRVSGAVFRLAGEAALIVAVAVLAAIARLPGSLIVAAMAAVLLVVLSAEWLVARSRFVPPGVAFVRYAVAPGDVRFDPEPETPLESDPWERGTFY